MSVKLETIKASELQRSSGKVLKRVANDREHLVVESDGYKVAVMVPYPDYQLLIRLQAARAMKALLEKTGSDEFSDEAVMADALTAVAEVRRTRRPKK
jgi:PHD/YefM family antitoxin component YafN of YafNO toxin-antitoxin module